MSGLIYRSDAMQLIDKLLENSNEITRSIWFEEVNNLPQAEAAPTVESEQRIAELEAKLKVAREALDKLARLGNEPRLGNSVGNEIAKEALNKIGNK